MNRQSSFNKFIMITIVIIFEVLINNFSYVNASEPNEDLNILPYNSHEFDEIFTDNSISSNDIVYISGFEHLSEIVPGNISEL